jgi:hypothetical protein
MAFSDGQENARRIACGHQHRVASDWSWKRREEAQATLPVLRAINLPPHTKLAQGTAQIAAARQ